MCRPKLLRGHRVGNQQCRRDRGDELGWRRCHPKLCEQGDIGAERRLWHILGGGICDGGMLTTAQLRDPFIFINNGYDFAAVWGESFSGANNGMPVLRAFGDTVYDAYVNVAGSASTTYGTLASLGGLTMTGVNADRVTLGWGSAVTTAFGAGSYESQRPRRSRARPARAARLCRLGRGRPHHRQGAAHHQRQRVQDL